MIRRLKPDSFSIASADTALFILLSAYLTLDWADFVRAYFLGSLGDIYVQILLRAACEIAVTALIIAWARPKEALKLNVTEPANIALSILLALFLYISMSALLSYLNYLTAEAGYAIGGSAANEAIVKLPFIVEFLFFCVLAPICEEFLFRGAILNAYKRKYGFAAVFISSAFFGFMHGDAFSILNGFIVGVFLGYVYLKTNSMWSAVTLHLFYNLFAFTLIPDIFITNLPWTSGVFDISLMSFSELAYCAYQTGISAIGVIAVVLIIKKLAALNSKNKIEKEPDYKKTPAERAAAAVTVMLLCVRASAAVLSGI